MLSRLSGTGRSARGPIQFDYVRGLTSAVNSGAARAGLAGFERRNHLPRFEIQQPSLSMVRLIFSRVVATQWTKHLNAATEAKHSLFVRPPCCSSSRLHSYLLISGRGERRRISRNPSSGRNEGTSHNLCGSTGQPKLRVPLWSWPRSSKELKWDPWSSPNSLPPAPT